MNLKQINNIYQDSKKIGITLILGAVVVFAGFTTSSQQQEIIELRAEVERLSYLERDLKSSINRARSSIHLYKAELSGK